MNMNEHYQVNEHYQKRVEEFVKSIWTKYVNRENIFEPISKILPKYWNDIFLRAVKNVMFKKTSVYPLGVKKNIWVLKPDTLDFKKITEQIIKEAEDLRELVWRKNGWKDSCKSAYKTHSFFSTHEFDNYNDFYDKYWKLLEYFVPNEEKRTELMCVIFNVVEKRFQDGLSAGIQSYKEKMNKDHIDRIIDVYNNIELALNNLKKIIDE